MPDLVIRVSEIRIPPSVSVTFRPTRHRDADRLAKFMLHAHEMQVLASEHGVNDIFQDSGGKVLQILIMLSAKCVPGRMGSDIFWIGSDTELKTLNTRLGNSGFTTHRCLDATVLARYRGEPWVFCICEGIEVTEAWWVHPARLEPVFAGWDDKLEMKRLGGKLGGKEPYINNPKIPMKLVREVGCPIDMSNSHWQQRCPDN